MTNCKLKTLCNCSYKACETCERYDYFTCNYYNNVVIVKLLVAILAELQDKDNDC